MFVAGFLWSFIFGAGSMVLHAVLCTCYLGIATCDYSVGSHHIFVIPWVEAAREAFVFFVSMAPVSAEEAAIRGALGRTHGVYKLARPLVDALVTYYIGRGETRA